MDSLSEEHLCSQLGNYRTKVVGILLLEVQTGSFTIIKLTRKLNEKENDKEIFPVNCYDRGSFSHRLRKRNLQHEYAFKEGTSFTHYGDFGSKGRYFTGRHCKNK